MGQASIKTMNLPIGYEDILAAKRRIKGGVVETPQEHSPQLSDLTGADIYLKMETFQYTSSFKERGTLNRLLTLSDEERQAGVIAVSAGNHAQSVAHHATRLGISSIIVMPKGTPFTKVRRTETLGAKVILSGDNFAEAKQHALDLQEKEGYTMVQTFDDPMIMAGHGTAGIEFLEKFSDLEYLLVPIGGGGLIGGVAVAAKTINPDIKIYGVQSEVYPSMKAALMGETITPTNQTIAEGIAIKEPGVLTKQVVEALVDDVLIVRETTIEKAINAFAEVEKLVVEGAGAATLAAVMQYPEMFNGRKTGIIVSGANIDPKILAYSLMRGLAQDGRISRLTVTTPDLPGGLASIVNTIAELGGNIVEVYHQRQFAAISVKYTQISVVVETKDAFHRDDIVAALKAKDLKVQVKEVTAAE